MNYYKRKENNTADITEREVLITRLREAGLLTERGVTVENGGKASYDHTLHPIPEIDGNYGVYAGDGLLFLDIDDYTDEMTIPEKIRDLPDTFTVRSPHGGTHHYYAYRDNLPRRLEEEFGKANPPLSVGEVRANNQLVVGPGSELTSCDKDWHDCSSPDEGQYTIHRNRPIETIDTGEFIEAVRADPQVTEGSDEPPIESNISELDQEITENSVVKVIQRVRRARTSDEKLDMLLKWADGELSLPELNDQVEEYEDYEKDERYYPTRSEADAALVAKCWYYSGDLGGPSLIYSLMTKIGSPKWKDELRKGNPKYGHRTIREINPDARYQPSQGGGVKRETMDDILTAFHGLDYKARTTEIAEHRTVKVSEEQVKTAMRALQERGYVESIQQGIYQYWVPTEDKWMDQNLSDWLGTLLTEEEVKNHRREYLSE